VVGSFVFFILCLVADFHEISNRFFKFLWDGSETLMNFSIGHPLQDYLNR